MSLRGNLRTIAGLKQKLRELPVSVAHEGAKRTAPALTVGARDALAAGRTVYGDARPLGVDGQPLTLFKSGKVAAQLRFVSDGTIVRASLGPKYARFLIGKYRILPNVRLPTAWQGRISEILDSLPDPLKALRR